MGGDESSLLLMDSDRSSKISLTSSPVDLHPTTKSKFHHNTPWAAGLTAVIHLLHPSMDHQRHQVAAATMMLSYGLGLGHHPHLMPSHHHLPSAFSFAAVAAHHAGHPGAIIPGLPPANHNPIFGKNYIIFLRFICFKKKVRPTEFKYSNRMCRLIKEGIL